MTMKQKTKRFDKVLAKGYYVASAELVPFCEICNMVTNDLHILVQEKSISVLCKKDLYSILRELEGEQPPEIEDDPTKGRVRDDD